MFAGASPDETERRLEEWAAQFAAKADRYQEMQARLSTISATEESPDGAVRVTVDSAGLLTGLELTDHAAQHRPPQLAALIMEVVRLAQSRLPNRVEQVMQETVGEDQVTVQTVVGSYEQRFPEPPPLEQPGYGGQDMRIGQVEDDGPAHRPPPHRPQPPQPRRPRRTGDDDDGWDDRPLMR